MVANPTACEQCGNINVFRALSNVLNVPEYAAKLLIRRLAG